MVGVNDLIGRCEGYLDQGFLPDRTAKPESQTCHYLIEPLLKLINWHEDPTKTYR